MRLEIKDTTIFNAISGLELISLLESKGWMKIDKIGDKAIIFGKNNTEVIIPIRKDLGDYSRRMAEAIATIALVEKKSQIALMSEI